MRVKQLQLWVHKNYDLIKLSMLTIILLLAALTFFRVVQNELRDNREQAEQAVQEAASRSEDLKTVLEAIDHRSIDTNKTINRMSALMVCLLEVHGQNQVISDEDREECRRVSNGAERRAESEANELDETQQKRNRSASRTPSQPDPPSNPPEEPRESILPIVDEPLVGCVDSVISVCL